MPDIFSYNDYRLYIRHACEELRLSKPFFSYRYIAQKAGLKSAGFLSWVIQGKRNMSLSLTHKISTILKLGKRESDYFELLVCHNQAKTASERRHYLDRIIAFHVTGAKVVDKDREQYYSRWYNSVVREVVAITGIRDESGVCSMIKPSITRSEAKEALDLLTRLGLIRKNENGIYERVDSALTSGANIDPAVIHGFQIQTMQLAQSSLRRFGKEDRDISTLTLSCDSKDLKKIKERIRQMRAEITEIACGGETADQVFQLNTQFFPMTKKSSEENS